MFIHRFFLVAFIVLLAIPCLAGNASALTIARNGRTDFRIVIGRDAIEPEKTAARELSGYLKQVTGADFHIRSESQVRSDAPQIVVGQCSRAKSILAGVDWNALGYDGIVLKTKGNTLVLAGGRPRGSLYAVYTFLEDTVGCRWWTSTESYIPRKRTLQVPALDVTYVPKLRYREAFYRDPIENPRFAAKLKLNGHFYNIPAEYGGHYSIIGWCHTFYSLLPPQEYFAQHPEWYSEINGKRTTDWAQLCLTNEEMRKELTKNALERIRKNPIAGIISISQNDWHGPCQCAKCKAVVQEEGSESGPLIRFVNAVAEDIEREFPEVMVETLAYQYTRKPPLHVRPRRNVVVRLCTIECSFTQPLEADANKAFRDDMAAWSAIAPNLYVWDYVTDFSCYLIPHPNMRVLAPNIRFFEKNNAIGVFEQGDSATSVGDFVRLRAWLLAHLLWNPSLDEKKLMSEFINGYYGAAGPYIAKYLDLIHDSLSRSGKSVGCYHQETSYLGLDELNEAMRLFNKAEAAVKNNPVLLRRIRRERLPLDHVWLLRYDSLKDQAQREGKPFLGPEDGAKACDEFIALAREWDVRNYSEGQAFETYVPSLKMRFLPPPPPPGQLLDGLKPEDYLEIQDSSFTLYDPPRWVQVIDDPKASDGRAACMGGGHTQWAVQYHVTDDVAKSWSGNWRCYMVIRSEAGPNPGGSFRIGLYDNNSRREVVTLGKRVTSGAESEYQTYYLGDHRLTKGMYFWVAPPGDAGAVKSVCVDRIVLIRARA